MTDDETRARHRAERITALIQMLRAFGQEATEHRLEALGLFTNPIPQHLFAAAVRRATIETSGGWPPGPGDIMRAAVALEPGELNPGQQRTQPRWYKHALGEARSRERPREIGRRQGGAAPDFAIRAAGGDA